MTLVVIGVSLAALGGLLYWQLVLAEGVYLGQGMVTLLYDRVAPRYDSIKGYDPQAEDLILGRPVATMLGHVGTPLILDVGTGTGRVIAAVMQQPDFQGHALGIDPSAPMLEKAWEKLRVYEPRVTLMRKTGDNLPFPDGAFDAIILVEMLEFTPSPAAQIAEAVRVLRPGGLVITSRRRGAGAAMMPGKVHSKAGFERMLTGAGLAEVRIFPWQVDYDLVWALKPGSQPKPSHRVEDVLQCPCCSRTGMLREGDDLRCAHCDTIRTGPIIEY
ncbi:MAG: class I SAM-dependent methyltransferase [Chloroflexi bacterium]|nr:class I SAM-dependent methyltransferase [Chloroflexota bacterium]